MIYIILIVALFTIMAARKKGGKRRYTPYIAGPVDEAFALGTLSASSVFRHVMTEAVVEKTWLSSVHATWSLVNLTEATDDGLIMVGLAHSDYTAAEIEEWIENTAGWSQADLIAQEVGKRKIRKVGVFDTPNITLTTAVLFDRVITTKCGWMLQSGQGLTLWAYNMGDSNLATTDPIVHVQGKANLWPR